MAISGDLTRPMPKRRMGLVPRIESSAVYSRVISSRGKESSLASTALPREQAPVGLAIGQRGVDLLVDDEERHRPEAAFLAASGSRSDHAARGPRRHAERHLAPCAI